MDRLSTRYPFGMHAGELEISIPLIGAIKKRVRAAVSSARAVAAATEPTERQVHRLRTTIRRACVAIAALSNADNQAARKLRRRLRRLRRLAGRVRDADVHMLLLAPLSKLPESKAPAEINEVLHLLAADRAAAMEALREGIDPVRLRRAERRCFAQPCPGQPAELSADIAPKLADEFLAAAADCCRDTQALHRLRIAIKKIRYKRELMGAPRDIPLSTEAQKRFGEVNDIATLVERLDGYEARIEAYQPADQTPESDRLLAALLNLNRGFRAVLSARADAAAKWWQKQTRGTTPQQLLAEFLPGHHTKAAPPPMNPAESTPVHPVSPRLNGSASVAVESEPPDASVIPTPAPPHHAQSNLWLAGLVIGVIDIGSNSIRLLVAEMIDAGSWRVVVEERAMTRLALGQAASGRLSPETMAVSVEAIGRLKRMAEQAGATTIRAFATAAVRDAKNRADFLSLVRDRTGLDIELVSEFDEGGMTYRSVARAFDLTEGISAVVDIGGGSMEVVFSKDGVVYSNRSMRLGAVRLTELFGGADAVAGSAYKSLCRHISKSLAKSVDAPPRPPAKVIGCGGTFTTLLTLAAARRGVHLQRASPALSVLDAVTVEELRSILADLRSRSLEERLRVPGLPSDRSDIVIAGLAAIDQLMRHLGSNEIYCHTGGVREGLLLRVAEESVAKRLGTSKHDSPRTEHEARLLAHRCGYERAHAEHVADLAISIFDQLDAESSYVPHLGEDSRERSMLHAAAILHDIGCSIEYRRHHKRSASMVRWTGLPSCDSREVEIIAQVCRYHRRAMPSLKHPEFVALSPRDRALVSRLAGVLRVADALDRSHRQCVQRAHLRFGRDELLIEVLSVHPCSEELATAAKKCDLLESVARTRLRFEVVHAAVPPASSGYAEKHD
jgi:exopolyphosphatase/guanosine-5'-triphosphate,3'-diphosphate pyrophosphatase